MDTVLFLVADFVFEFFMQDFYEDLFEELSKYGLIESLNVCDNLADHMVGNVYVQFRDEDHAANALKNLSGRYYAGRPIIVDFSPVTDFREATCRQYDEEICSRGGYCNFMHLKKISRELRRQLYGKFWRNRSRSRSRSPYRRNSYEEHSRGSRSRRRHAHHGYYERQSRRHRSPTREGSEERRAKIDQWNREMEAERAGEVDAICTDHGYENGKRGYVESGGCSYGQE